MKQALGPNQCTVAKSQPTTYPKKGIRKYSQGFTGFNIENSLDNIFVSQNDYCTMGPKCDTIYWSEVPKQAGFVAPMTAIHLTNSV